jgi:hypothetical protein
MRTIDGQYTKQNNFWHRLKRDLRLLRRIVRMLYIYLTVGSKIRKKYKKKADNNEMYWIDEQVKF